MKNSFLNQSFPYFKKKWLVVFITTLWVFIFFFSLTPIALNILKNIHYKWLLLYFTGAAFFSSTIVTYLFPLLFKRFHDPEKWTRGKFLLFSLSITTIMWLFAIGINEYILEKEGYVSMFHPLLKIIILYTPCLFISLFPTAAIYLIEDFLHKKHNSDVQMNLDAVTINPDVNLVKIFKSTKDEFELDINHFLYAEVIKNNVTLYYLDKENVCQKTIRATLIQLLDYLKEYTHIVRTHRAFIVNTHFIANIRGNSHGYKLTMNNLKNSIPVSKTYTKEIKELLFL